MGPCILRSPCAVLSTRDIIIIRHYYSSPYERGGSRPPVKTLEEACEVLPEVLKNLFLYGLETLAYKGLIFYVGYKATLHNSPFHPEKYIPELMSLCEKKQLLDVEMTAGEERKIACSARGTDLGDLPN